jgi:hypothetical protein
MASCVRFVTNVYSKDHKYGTHQKVQGSGERRAFESEPFHDHVLVEHASVLMHCNARCCEDDHPSKSDKHGQNSMITSVWLSEETYGVENHKQDVEHGQTLDEEGEWFELPFR